ncbi:dipeptidase PepE [Curtobacterium sp. MCSS17_015]|uniref:dipeptidase PepE n=1 Tax=Curtobacterium sp. MCSS17_015 TaxID=2175666 RepID=UPI000DA76FAB|nr:dipeptidase PepE [Curtobacterium sp. MCSS17_015]WIB26589.1 dipeptidase PepE [Curtobacterium sp. MCSS17_015]
MTNALLFSNSTNHGGTYLGHALDVLEEHYAGVGEVLFAPWALADHDGYMERVAPAFRAVGTTVRGLHTVTDPSAAIRDAGGLYVGGGNTFRLASALHRHGLVDTIRHAVVDGGLRYGGASAGTVVAAPTMRTTNDMPIAEPPSFRTIGLVPFQINPHYLDADPTSTHAGETREQRLAEFLEQNDVAVVGLREGTWLRLRSRGDGEGSVSATIGGAAVSAGTRGPAVLLERGRPVREVHGDVSELLELTPQYDRAVSIAAG